MRFSCYCCCFVHLAKTGLGSSSGVFIYIFLLFPKLALKAEIKNEPHCPSDLSELRL